MVEFDRVLSPLLICNATRVAVVKQHKSRIKTFVAERFFSAWNNPINGLMARARKHLRVDGLLSPIPRVLRGN